MKSSWEVRRDVELNLAREYNALCSQCRSRSCLYRRPKVCEWCERELNSYAGAWSPYPEAR